jgi:hypothetical protein
MNAKRIVVLFLVAILVCSATVMSVSSELQALDTGGSGATVVSLPPEVESVTADPAVLTIDPGDVVTQLTVTAKVFGPCGIDWIKSVEITDMDPYFSETHMAKIFPLPIPMKRVRVDGLTRAKYERKIDVTCMPHGDYTLTVTATDKEGNTDTGTATFTVAKVLALSVTDVDFGTLAPSKSGEAYSTVVNIGNVPFVLEQSGGIVPTEMSAGGAGIIEASNIAVSWDWSKRMLHNTGPVDAKFTLTVPWGTLPGDYTGMISFTPTEKARPY